MKPSHLLLAFVMTAAPFSAWAADASAPKMTSLEAALTDCAAKVKKDAEGMPDQEAMLKCMQSKGFSGPNGEQPKPAGAKAK